MSINKDIFKHSEINSSKELKKATSKNAGTLVRIKDYNPSKHLLKVVRQSNGEPLEEDINIIGDLTQAKPYEQRRAKTLKTSEEQDGPIAEITDDMVSIRGSSTDGFFSTHKNGNIITGPLSIGAAPQDVRLAGITTLNPLLITGFPSTIVTPIPTAIINIPGAIAMKNMAKDVATMAVLVAALGV